MKTHKIATLLLFALLGCQPIAPVDVRKAALVAKPQANGPQIAVVPWSEQPTLAIQAALDQRGTVIIPNVGQEWENIDGLVLHSNTTLRFEAGVVFTARRTGFRELGACLFNIVDAENVRVLGDFAMVRGWAAELSDCDRVPHSQWRHGFKVVRSSRVRIEGLTISEFGGDGIYIRECSNVQVRRVTCDGNYRNGISVISGVGIWIEDSTFRATRGNLPQAGIDIEANSADQQLFGILFRRCLAQGNNGAGFVVGLDKLTPDSPRVHVQFIDCVSRDNRSPTPITSANHGLPPNSMIEFKRCVFHDERWDPTRDIATYTDCKRIQTTHKVEKP